MSSLTTETDLKANKLYYKLSEDERKMVLAMPAKKFRLLLDQFNKDGRDMVSWIKYKHLTKDMPVSMVTDILEGVDLTRKDWPEWAVRILSNKKYNKLDSIVAAYREFISLLPDGILDHNLPAIPKDLLEPELTYPELAAHIRFMRRHRMM